MPVLLGLSVLLFLWVRALPGGPASPCSGSAPPPRRSRGSTSSTASTGRCSSSTSTYIGRLLRGDFGVSVETNDPVLTESFTRFPATIELTVAALIFAVGVGIPLGYYAARRRQPLAGQRSW